MAAVPLPQQKLDFGNQVGGLYPQQLSRKRGAMGLKLVLFIKGG